jgi:hypothetical protein
MDKVDFMGSSLSNVNYYGVTAGFDGIQPVEVSMAGMTDAEFDRVSVIAMGNEIAENYLERPTWV